jgi:ABC-2 type transport system permease protein
MLRPVDLYWLWYSRGLALRTAPALLRSAPMFIVAGLFLGLSLPASWASAAAFGFSLLGALLLTTAIGTLATITLFWTVSGEGLARLIPMATWFASGIMIPLPLLPDWIQPIMNVLPFRGIIDAPFRLYMGHIPAH